MFPKLDTVPRDLQPLVDALNEVIAVIISVLSNQEKEIAWDTLYFKGALPTLDRVADYISCYSAEDALSPHVRGGDLSVWHALPHWRRRQVLTQAHAMGCFASVGISLKRRAGFVLNN